jgi:hypothetical protein
MLVDTLYRDLAYAASDKPETADITLAFVRHSLRAGPELLAAGWRDLMRKRTLSTLYYIADYQNYVPAQSLLGDLYAEAEVLPKSPAAAALWYARAEAGGADTGAAIGKQLAELPDTLKRLVTRAMDISYTPWLVTEPDDITKLHAFREEHFARSE